ncbi:JAB-like toxin 1 domain-containing protein [Aureispira anguillae]|nr:JAB-like toxin 1 domain-containing protein [Aureispira anguillae]
MKTILTLVLIALVLSQAQLAQGITPLNSSHVYGVLDDYKVNENGKIKLAQQTKDTFDRLIFIAGKKGKLIYRPKDGKLLNPHLIIDKGVLSEMILLKRKSGKSGKEIFKGLKLNFKQQFNTAKRVFEFLADHTSIEWSLLSFSIEEQNRTYVYTTFRNDVEYFGSLKVHHLINCPLKIDSLIHYHNHPRTSVEAFGKYAFPSNSDLDFRDNILKKGIQQLEFKIRTDGIYVDYGSPEEWSKRNGEDWM